MAIAVTLHNIHSAHSYTCLPYREPARPCWKPLVVNWQMRQINRAMFIIYTRTVRWRRDGIFHSAHTEWTKKKKKHLSLSHPHSLRTCIYTRPAVGTNGTTATTTIRAKVIANPLEICRATAVLYIHLRITIERIVGSGRVYICMYKINLHCTAIGRGQYDGFLPTHYRKYIEIDGAWWWLLLLPLLPFCRWLCRAAFVSPWLFLFFVLLSSRSVHFPFSGSHCQ